MNLPLYSIVRLCTLFGLTSILSRSGVKEIPSSELSRRLGITAESIRKDISFLGETGRSRTGYDVETLKNLISRRLGLNRIRTVCIVGLGKLGCAILGHPDLLSNGFRPVAGFDTNINKVEMLRTAVPLFPAYQMAQIVRRDRIEIGVLAVPGDAAAECAQTLAEGGIGGILNCTSMPLMPPRSGIVVRNVDIVNELRVVSSLMTLRTTDAVDSPNT